MDVIETIKLVAEVGVLVAIAGIFLYLSFRRESKMQDWLDDFIKRLSSDGHPTKEATANLEKINAKIYQEMQGLLTSLDADRSYVVLYHNGGKSSSGYFFQKMSCICEIVHSGIQPMSPEFQNVHRASYNYLLNRLSNEDVAFTELYEDIKDEDPFSYSQLVDRHVKSCYMTALKDIDGTHIGFIGIDYCADHTTTTAEICKLLKTVGHKVEPLVDLRDEVKD